MYDVNAFRKISQQDLAALGLGEVAYVRSVVIDGTPGFAIYAANGKALGAVASSQAAQAAIRQNDLEPVSLH